MSSFEPTVDQTSAYLTRSDEVRLEVARPVRPFSFEAAADNFRLAAEARRIRLAHLFEP